MVSTTLDDTNNSDKRKRDDQDRPRQDEELPSIADEPVGLGARRKRVRLEVVTNNNVAAMSTSPGQLTGGSFTSLFTTPDDEGSHLIMLPESSPLVTSQDSALTAASRFAPSIPGLFFAPEIRLPLELAEELMEQCMNAYFRKNTAVNQVMLFGRATITPPPPPPPPPPPHAGDSELLLPDTNPRLSNSSSGLPPFLVSLLSTLEKMLLPVLPAHTHSLLFPPVTGPTRARQAILNLYNPGEGISPHVDLLHRFGDGIIGLSLGSGCVMRFRKERGEEVLGIEGLDNRDHWDLYLPERTVLVLSGEARYGWTHGIEGRADDLVQGEEFAGDPTWIARGVRLSITFRWLLPGADIVGS
jgi:hypothetical protein